MNILKKVIEYFSANPCGDGGASPGFQPGNTCASGGRPHDARRAGLLYHVEKSQPIKMSELRRRLGHPDLTPDNPVHAMVADLVKSGEITLSVVDGEPAASLGAKASPPAPGEFPTAFRKAFDAIDSRNGRTNFVKLHALRGALGVGRKEFDAGLRKLRAAGEFTMDSHEGLHGSLTPEEREAGIEEAGSKFIYVSRRSESFSMLRLVERFAAHPCGDGGGEQGFHVGNTCQKGGAGAGHSPADAAKSTGKVLKKGAGGKFKIDLAKKGVAKKASKSADPVKSLKDKLKKSFNLASSELEDEYLDMTENIKSIAKFSGDAKKKAKYFHSYSENMLKFMMENLSDLCAAAGVDEAAIAPGLKEALGVGPDAPPPPAEKADQKDSPSSYDPRNIGSIRAWGKKHFDKWAKSVTQEEQDAIEMYSGSGYKQMNATMRGFVYPENMGMSYDDVKKHIENLNRALYKGKAPEDMNVVRGYAGPPSIIFGVDPGEVLPGATIRDPAFMSTTLNHRPPGIAQNASGEASDETVVKITLPKGTPGAYLPAGEAHGFDIVEYEQEFLIPAGYGHLRITGYSRDSAGRHVLDAVMVPNDDRTLKIPTRAESKLNAPPSKPHETPDSEYGSYSEDQDKYNNDYLGYDADHPKAKKGDPSSNLKEAMKEYASGGNIPPGYMFAGPEKHVEELVNKLSNIGWDMSKTSDQKYEEISKLPKHDLVFISENLKDVEELASGGGLHFDGDIIGWAVDKALAAHKKKTADKIKAAYKAKGEKPSFHFGEPAAPSSGGHHVGDSNSKWNESKGQYEYEMP